MKDTEPTDCTDRAPTRARWLALALFASAIVAYLPALQCGFVWDDDAYVTENPMLTATDGLKQIWFSTHSQSQYFPLVYTSFRLQYALWGLNPMGYHAVNMALHALNAVLLWVVLRRFLKAGAWLAAAAWALHPVQVESVAWITELKNTQSLLFCLLALLAWLKFADAPAGKRWGFYGLALGLQALALFSKTTACTLPAALLLALWWRGEAIRWRRIVQVSPFLLLGVAMGLVSVWWEGHLGNYREESGADLGWLERTLIASRALWFYAEKLLWPANLAFSYPKWEINVREPWQYGWLVGCFLVAGLLWWKRRQLDRGVLVGVAFFVATLSPLLGFIWLYTFRFTFVADHYQYVASIGLVAVAAVAIHRATGRLAGGNPWATPAVGGVLLLTLGVLTWRQCGMYRDMETLWRTTLARNPTSWMSHNNLGRTLDAQGKTGEAIRHYREALRLNPGYALAHSNLGGALFHAGKTDEALVHLRRALELDPELMVAHENLGKVLVQADRLDEARQQFELCLRHNPDHPDAHYNLGNLAFNERKPEEALAHYRAAVRSKPDHLWAQHNLGATLAALDRLAEATAVFGAVLKLNPDFAPSQFHLGELCLKQGRPAEARGWFEAALRSQPDFAEAHHRLAKLLVASGEISEAVPHLRRAVEIKPDLVEALNSLAWRLATAPDAQIRDGAEAVLLAERAVRLLGGNEAHTLDTLAAAYAEAGRFSEAVITARKAAEVAEAAVATPLADDIRHRLQWYQAGRAARE